MSRSLKVFHWGINKKILEICQIWELNKFQMAFVQHTIEACANLVVEKNHFTTCP